MTDLLTILDSVFRYERKRNVLHQAVIEAFKFKSEFLNVSFSNAEYDINGTIPFIHPDKKGLVLAFHTSEVAISKKGNPLPGSFAKLPDCSFMYYGMMASCMALLYTKKRFSHAVLFIQPTGEKIPLTLNLPMAQRFLLEFRPATDRSVYLNLPVQAQNQFKHVPQTNLFAA